MSRSPRSAALELGVCTSAFLQVHPLPPSGVVRIGRDVDNDLRIDSPSVSRKHAVLHMGPPLRIEDVGSKGGTFLDTTPPLVSDGTTHSPRQIRRQEVPLDVGQGFLLGTVLMVVRRVSIPSDPPPPEAVFGKRVVVDEAMRKLYEHCARMAEGNLPLLFLGESGSGKDVLASWIHQSSRRAERPFKEINCAAMPETLVEAELFGTARGAFTGAVDRAGLFEAAHGGTLFLDEVGDLALATQAKLLRVLERGEVTRLGSQAPRKIDVRFVAATNKDLAQAMREKAFREDLFFRLKGEMLRIPPLRERVADILPLAASFLRRFCLQLERSRVPTISAAAQRLLERHPWPGNVRELLHAMERAALLSAHAEELLPEHLPHDLVSAPPAAPPPPAAGGNMRGEVDQMKQEIERRRIVEALARCAGNQTRAAALLEISRRTLVYRMKQYEIPGPR